MPPQSFGEANTLCDVCRAILQSYAGALDDGIVGETTQLLEIRADQGCRLCLLFLGAANRSFRSAGIDMQMQELYQKHEGRGDIIVRYLKQKKRASYYDLDAILLVCSNDQEPKMFFRSTLGFLNPSELNFAPMENLNENVTASAESLGLANRWIEECQSSHNCCQRQTTRKFCPTRLIDVGKTAANTVHLCMGKDLPPGTSYFTLSHCWGTKPMPERLLENNLHSKFALINYDKLPRNFQDSIRIVRGLGGRYIWIDSLCIIQDSVEDWEHESALMGEVYLNGYCNLSAVASLDSSIGMIFSRQPLDILPLRTRLKVELEHQEQDVYLCDSKLWYYEIARSPLLSRAWVCQERLLSICNLHFGQTQIFWECPQHTACETFPKGIPIQIEGYAIDPNVKLKGAQLLRPTFNSESRTLDDPSHPLILWDLIVALYSTCQLSFGSDKLVAIGGMAAMSHQNFSGNYLAGLWQEYLPYQLLWQVFHTVEDSQPPLYRAPTWSWAAVDHKLVMHDTNSYCVALIDVLDAHIDLAGSNRYGQVKGGYIQMLCGLAPAQIDKYGWLVPSSSKKAIFCTWDYSLMPGSKDETFYLVPVCGGNYQHLEDFDRKHPLTGLIIVEAKDGSSDFVRSGTFEMDSDDAGDITKCCQLFADDVISSRKGWVSDGKGRFTIRII